MLQRKATAGKTEYYYYIGGVLAYITDQNNKLRCGFTRNASGQLLTMTDYTGTSPQNYFYVLNNRGDVVGLRMFDGTMAVSYTYDSFGNVSWTGARGTGDGKYLAQENPFRYASYFYDEETGLYYLKSRYYDPKVGRFLTRDSISSQSNLYVYVQNNPVTKVDSYGHWGIPIPALVGLGEAFGEAVVAVGAVLAAPELLIGVAVAGAAVGGYAIYRHYHSENTDTGYSTSDAVADSVPDSSPSAGSDVSDGVAADGAIGQDNTDGAVGSANTVPKSASKGRSGKQARLKELAQDDKLSSALRGEIKRDMNMVANGKRPRIRVPQGYELAHRRGMEARKGYGYDKSDLQMAKNHKLQHRFDNNGRKR